MNLCLCGCAQEVSSNATGRPGKFFSGACRVRYHRQNKSVTKLSIDVTKVVDEHEPVTISNEPLKRVLKYPGAKWLLAPWIIEHFPKHSRYIEPYFGSGAVFFQKPLVKHQIINDMDEQVVNLFTVMRDHGEQLAELIEMTPWSRQEYYESYELTGKPLEDARRFLVRCWQAHGVKTSDKTGWMNIGPQGNGSTSSRWYVLPDRIRDTTNRLRGDKKHEVEIEHTPALELIKKYKDVPDCLIFCDPPYVTSTRSKQIYKHEMNDQDHIELLDALDLHAGPVVLSGYTHPLYDDRLAHWQRVTVSSVAEKGQTRTEVLWLNAKAKRQQLSLFDEEAI